MHATTTWDAARNGGRRRLVLFADHDPALRRVIGSALEGDSYDVIEAADGFTLLSNFDAVVTVRHEPPDSFLVLAEVRLPGLTGLEVLAIIRCSGWVTPVILISTLGDEVTHAKGRELGAAALLVKPFDLQELRSAVVETMRPSWPLRCRGATPRATSHGYRRVSQPAARRPSRPRSRASG